MPPAGALPAGLLLPAVVVQFAACRRWLRRWLAGRSAGCCHRAVARPRKSASWLPCPPPPGPTQFRRPGNESGPRPDPRLIDTAVRDRAPCISPGFVAALQDKVRVRAEAECANESCARGAPW